ISPDVPSVQLVSQDPPSQGCEGSQREDLLPVSSHVSSVSRHPDDETSAFRVQSPLRQYYVCTAWGNFLHPFYSPRIAIHAGRTIEKLADHSNDSDAREKSRETVSNVPQISFYFFFQNRGANFTHIGFEVSGTKWPAEGILLVLRLANKICIRINWWSVCAWEGTILVTQFVSTTAAATVAASLAADANFLSVSEQTREGEGQGRKIRKSRDRTEHFPKGRKELTENEISGACFSRSRKQRLGRIEGRLVLVGACTGKACRYFGKREKSTPENYKMIPSVEFISRRMLRCKRLTQGCEHLAFTI
ncbi:hypothetical protein ALC62_07002, partial [Cyphomyrmex costatus]